MQALLQSPAVVSSDNEDMQTYEGKEKNAKTTDSACSLLDGDTGIKHCVDENFSDKILSNMCKDKLLRIVKTDILIQQVGAAVKTNRNQGNQENRYSCETVGTSTEAAENENEQWI